MSGPLIVGLAGRAGAGKDTVASFMQQVDHRWCRIAFADPLRAAAKELWGLTDEQMHDPHLKEVVLDEWGLSPRRILQLLGTEVGRAIHPETWVRHVERRIEGLPLARQWVITDVRFDNELAWIRSRGGQVWWVERPGARSKTGAAHATERALSADGHWDGVIVNDGTLADLRDRVGERLRGLGVAA